MTTEGKASAERELEEMKKKAATTTTSRRLQWKRLVASGPVRRHPYQPIACRGKISVGAVAEALATLLRRRIAAAIAAYWPQKAERDAEEPQ